MRKRSIAKGIQIQALFPQTTGLSVTPGPPVVLNVGGGPMTVMSLFPFATPYVAGTQIPSSPFPCTVKGMRVCGHILPIKPVCGAGGTFTAPAALVQPLTFCFWGVCIVRQGETVPIFNYFNVNTVPAFAPLTSPYSTPNYGAVPEKDFMLWGLEYIDGISYQQQAVTPFFSYYKKARIDSSCNSKRELDIGDYLTFQVSSACFSPNIGATGPLVLVCCQFWVVI